MDKNIKTILLCLALAGCTAVATANAAKGDGVIPTPREDTFPLVGDAKLVAVDRLPPLNVYVMTYALQDGGCIRVHVSEAGTLSQQTTIAPCGMMVP